MKRLSSKLRHAAHRYSEYRRIVTEIEGMSQREADDLGIHRNDAREIARQAVYG
ncbi:DUF1127 domain-containing protein [Ovoidimarina sediminis]|uniref:DUF1127 domain-containing protein n=1 Tax=Ovoidimarina sediminis TaxID=3079856 RepID=UPI002909E83B|nr:DUF1127 domain-containing protein [Rhodophyticola sp. MJ-SS7]MDU8942226.1 DUF1127 domain-containing protein [Rhodophyticola sp. MJ-SS7]